MSASRRFTWKSRIALMVLTIWIGVDGFSAIVEAQVQPPRRKRRIMVSPKKEPKAEKTEVNIGKSLLGIARRASRQSRDKMVDIVFVVEHGEKTKGLVAEIEVQLDNILHVFEESGVNYRLASVWFQNQRGPIFGGSAFTNDIRAIQAGLNAQIQSKQSAGHGLEAMMWGVRELDFRSNASKHMIVATSSQLGTAWDAPNAIQQLMAQIIERCKQDDIHINVIGVNEAVQLQLAEQTGGRWYAVDEYQKPRTPASYLDKRIQHIDGIFELIGEHIIAGVKSSADIVFVFDSSFSMESKTDEICTGVDRLAAILDEGGLDYRFGIIRFWALAGGGESTVVVTKPPLDLRQVKKVFQLRKEGDEHLLDAIMEGVPKLKTPENRQLVLIVVTDESTSRRRDKGYTPDMAIGVCRQAGAIVYVMGGFRHLRDSERDAFQRRVAEVTKGEQFVMPGSKFPDERW